MSRPLQDLRPVSVVGVGLHPYQRPSDTPYVALGVRAIRQALADAGLQWSDVESAYTGTCLLYTSPSPRDATLSRMPSSA